MKTKYLQLGWTSALVVFLGLTGLAVPAFAAGEAASEVTREAIVDNDIRLTRSTASAATAAGVRVDAYDSSKQMVWEAGDTSVERTILEVEIKSAEMAKVYEMAAKLAEHDAPVQIQRVALRRRRGESSYRLRLFVATYKTNAKSPEVLPKELPDEVRRPNAWHLTAGLVRAAHEDWQTVDRIDVDSDRQVVEIQGLVEKPQDYDRLEMTLSDTSCLEAVDTSQPLKVLSTSRVRFHVQARIDCETAPTADLSYAAAHWKVPDEKRKSERKTESSSEDSAKEPATATVTVYSKPKGEIVINGVFTGKQSPETVRLTTGEHEVRVHFEGDGPLSQAKTVRTRKGGELKLFFRQQSD